jgi:hypothetical protein
MELAGDYNTCTYQDIINLPIGKYYLYFTWTPNKGKAEKESIL